MNPKITQQETAKELGYSISSVQRYRQDIIMLPLYRITPNSRERRQRFLNTNLDDNSISEHELKRSQLISNEVRTPQMTSIESSLIIEMVNPNTSKKNTLKGCGNIEINEYLDRILLNNNL